jgi:hypothetical protein
MSLKRPFLYSLILLLVLWAGMNLVLSVAARTTLPRRLLAHAAEARSAKVVALGDSLVAAGFSESAFDGVMRLAGERGSANLGLNGSTPVEDLLLFNYALQRHLRPQVLIYGFHDFQLTSPVAFTTSDIVGNRALLYYADPEYGRRFYFLSIHDGVEFEIMRHISLMVERSAVWEKITPLRRRMGAQGLPPEETNRLGRLKDFAALEAAGLDALVNTCKSASSMPLSAPIAEIIRRASDAGAQVFFVEMPTHPARVRLLYDTDAWARYRGHLQSMLTRAGVQYVDASQWMRDERMFIDHLHLSESAAVPFTQRLARYLQQSIRPRAETQGAEVHF